MRSEGRLSTVMRQERTPIIREGIEKGRRTNGERRRGHTIENREGTEKEVTMSENAVELFRSLLTRCLVPRVLFPFYFRSISVLYLFRLWVMCTI
jgi:hypothetical protein